MSIDEGGLKLADLVQQFNDVSLTSHPVKGLGIVQQHQPKEDRKLSMSRAASSPALHQLRQHMTESCSSITASHLDTDKPVDTTVEGFQTAAGARIDL